MNRTRYEVLPANKNERWSGEGNRWKVTEDGTRINTTRTKAQAVRFAVDLARGRWQTDGQLGTLKIKGRAGRIQDERTYGKDPRRTKG